MLEPSEQRGKLISYVLNGAESYDPGGDAVETERLPIRFTCELREDKPVEHRAAVYVDRAGLHPESSVLAAVSGGRVDGRELRGASISGATPEFGALVVNGGEYRVEDCRIDLRSDSDGRRVCDFAGLGSAIDVFDGGEAYVNNTEVETSGVAKCAFFADMGGSLVARDCKFRVMGGKLYEGYINSADFNYMVAPPWVLGITGSARGTNLMGSKSSMALINCDMTAGGWGVVSTDNGENNVLTVADSTLTLEPCNGEERENPYFRRWGSGYGSYILGADEQFYGVEMHVGTYIGIARDGSATYRSSEGLVRHVSPHSGRTLYEGQGKGRRSLLESDAFGIMAHGFADLRFLEGTVMNTVDASFLLRCGGVNITVAEKSELNTRSGVILQLLDDDDALVGVDWESDIELKFHTEFNEKPGWPSENGQISSLMPPPPAPPLMPMEDPEHPHPQPRFDVRFTAADTHLRGALYNGSGYYGQRAKQLYVTLEAGAVLDGVVSATETIHVDERGEQNTHFTSRQYYYLGRVKNRDYYNGDNDAEVTLKSGSVWNVSGPCLISALTVEEGATLSADVSLDGRPLSPVAGQTYKGRITLDKMA